MKNLLLSAFVLLSAISAYAQIRIPQPSPTATLTQNVGLTEVEIVYSRPGVKDRKIFGDLIPYGEVWRTGANASTKVTFKEEVKLGGEAVPAGTYALYTIPGAKEWTVIVHKNTTLWGAGNYNKEEDLVRFTVPAATTKDFTETFTIDFSDFTSTSAHLNIKWENTLVAIPLEVEVESKVMAQIKEEILEAEGEVNPELYAGAASYYLESGKDLKQALIWVDEAIKANPSAFWLIHRKAKILAKQGKKKEAIATAKESMKMAKESPQGDFGYVKNNENLIAEINKSK
ncbi:DUF2911 domain-containing protein [Fulvivirga sediminis]|uniref:DUF2911 domain-containing protein n=1 Tax=Fulvivirga sediminis TaxID=2803949 RepID=A0A937K192_9BACT|nr:DUF2911 domain-containing protein [Fulvivirga sediminis]MBL3658374.1 DUF2911 domain-containing protein [Fulvivirga sediminis]